MDIDYFWSQVEDKQQSSLTNNSSPIFLIESINLHFRRKLEESEAANKNLQSYITNLKKSYHSVFAGSDSKDEKTEEIDTSVPTSQLQD